jgi:type IV secretory pathway TrbD component
MCAKSDFAECALAKGFAYKQKKVRAIQTNLNERNSKHTDYIVANFSAVAGFTLRALRSLLITAILFGIRRLLVVS